MVCDLGIEGGIIVSGSGQGRANLYIKDEAVAALTTERLETRERVDASGLFVLPGMVDGHVHFSQEEVLKYGPLRKFTPPARSRAEAEGLWQRLTAGEICWHPRERWLPSPV